MTVNSPQLMLKKTLAPVILVVIFWFVMSAATTYYVQWLEGVNQRFLVKNIVSIRAAESLQNVVWRLAAECPVDEVSLPSFRLRWNEAAEQLTHERRRLDDSTFSDAEKKVVLKLDSLLMEFRNCLNQVLERTVESGERLSGTTELSIGRSRVIEIASRIALSTNELLRINQATADRDTMRLHQISRVVFVSRLAMLVIGPLVGVLLGWRLALQLHHSIARISVTLHDAGTGSENHVGTVAIESSGDFQDVQQQAEQVAERMRQVSRDLQIARREVLQSERLAAVGELAAGVAHEIRNPLTSVKLLLQHAIRQASGPHLDESKLRLILEEIGRMETTIQGLLDFSRPPKLNRVISDLRLTLQRALNLLDARVRQQGIVIATQITDVPLMVDGDTEKLHQVLVNLLINAIEAMPNGGRLSIDVVSSAPSNSFASTHLLQDQGYGAVRRMAQVIIRDTGEGIADELLPRLFEPFATTKERGTGLGLAVSHRIVEEHHGTIQACNLPGGGAQFTLNIPLAETMRDSTSC